jgi:hypothetical protein
MKSVNVISIMELSDLSKKMYGNLVKAVVDLANESMVVDAEMHADEEEYLLKGGSKQADLWGINLYPDMYGTDEFIEFDSMINIRPRQHNMSRDIEDKAVRQKIIALVSKKVKS